MVWKIQKDGEYLQGRALLSALSKVNNVKKKFFCPLILFLYLMEYACAEIYKILGDQIQRELETSDFVSTFLCLSFKWQYGYDPIVHVYCSFFSFFFVNLL